MDYKEICKECNYRYICGGKCMASESEYDYKCTFAKAMFKYVLFYYKHQDKNRENLESYVQYLEKTKKYMGERYWIHVGRKKCKIDISCSQQIR